MFTLYGFHTAPKQHGQHYIGALFLKSGAIMQMERQPNHRRQMNKIVYFVADLTVKTAFITFFWTFFSVIRVQLGF